MHQDVTEFVIITRNCKTIFEQFSINSSVEFVRRQANETTYKLVKATTFLDSFPDFDKNTRLYQKYFK